MLTRNRTYRVRELWGCTQNACSNNDSKCNSSGFLYTLASLYKSETGWKQGLLVRGKVTRD